MMHSPVGACGAGLGFDEGSDDGSLLGSLLGFELGCDDLLLGELLVWALCFLEDFLFLSLFLVVLLPFFLLPLSVYLKDSLLVCTNMIRPVRIRQMFRFSPCIVWYYYTEHSIVLAVLP
jgi:hypothetical protein